MKAYAYAGDNKMEMTLGNQPNQKQGSTSAVHTRAEEDLEMTLGYQDPGL